MSNTVDLLMEYNPNIYWSFHTCILCANVYGASAEDYDTEIDDWYDPYNVDDDDVWDDPGLPDEQEESYPEVQLFNISDFEIFTVDFCDGGTIIAASYPYQRTENGLPLFQYEIRQVADGTDFVISDNNGDFTVHIDEPLTGKFCSLLKMSKSWLTVQVWGGVTTEPYAEEPVYNRQVTFTPDQIILGG